MRVAFLFGILDARFCLVGNRVLDHFVEWDREELISGDDKAPVSTRPSVARFVGEVSNTAREEQVGDRTQGCLGAPIAAAARKLATFVSNEAAVLQVPGWRTQAKVRRWYSFRNRSLATFELTLSFDGARRYEVPQPFLFALVQRVLGSFVRFPKVLEPVELLNVGPKLADFHIQSSTSHGLLRDGKSHGEFVAPLHPVVIVTDKSGVLNGTSGFRPIRLGLVDYQYSSISGVPVHVVRQSMLYRCTSPRSAVDALRAVLAAIHLDGEAVVELFRFLVSQRHADIRVVEPILRHHLDLASGLTSSFGREAFQDVVLSIQKLLGTESWPFRVAEVPSMLDAAQVNRNQGRAQDRIVFEYTHFFDVVAAHCSPTVM